MLVRIADVTLGRQHRQAAAQRDDGAEAQRSAPSRHRQRPQQDQNGDANETVRGSDRHHPPHKISLDAVSAFKRTVHVVADRPDHRRYTAVMMRKAGVALVILALIAAGLYLAGFRVATDGSGWWP